MEELRVIGISEYTIDIIKDNTTKGEKLSIDTCMDRLKSSILYLREIGVRDEVIEEILQTDHHVLMPGRKYLERSLSKLNHPNSEIKDIPTFVAAINEDVRYVDYLMNIT